MGDDLLQAIHLITFLVVNPGSSILEEITDRCIDLENKFLASVAFINLLRFVYDQERSHQGLLKSLELSALITCCCFLLLTPSGTLLFAINTENPEKSFYCKNICDKEQIASTYMTAWVTSMQVLGTHSGCRSSTLTCSTTRMLHSRRLSMLHSREFEVGGV